MSRFTGALRSRALLPGQQPGQPGPQRPRRVLGLVPRHRPRVGRAPFVALLLVLGGAGLVGLLVVNTTMQSRAFELTALQERGDRLAAREAALRAQVDALESPQQVGSRAAALGMVPNPGPVFLRLSDGRVVGDPKPAEPGTNLRGLDDDPGATVPGTGADAEIIP